MRLCSGLPEVLPAPPGTTGLGKGVGETAPSLEISCRAKPAANLSMANGKNFSYPAIAGIYSLKSL